MARSLLYLVSNDIGQISTLYAMLHSIKSVYFGGFFLRHHPVGLHTISHAVKFWSKGQVSANFLRHEGYLGAIGAFIRGAGTAEYHTDRSQSSQSAFIAHYFHNFFLFLQIFLGGKSLWKQFFPVIATCSNKGSREQF
jgi:hypothetical protein